MNSQDQDDDKTAVVTPDDATPEKPPPTRRRDPRFRAELLARLPQLGFESWSAREDFRADEEWAGIVSLRSDAVLGPLETLASGRRGG